MFQTPDGKTYETEGEYKDAMVCYEWRNGGAERARQQMVEGRAEQRRSRLQSQAGGEWDATYPGFMRRRHNLRGR